MASRKWCEGCNRNFGKSAFYDHLPCKYQSIQVEKDDHYVFCDHCNKKVAKKTYYEHQRSKSISSSIADERSNGLCHESGHGPAEPDQSINLSHDEESDSIFDDEDQVFFCETDEQESIEDFPAVADYDVANDCDTHTSDEGFQYCDDDEEIHTEGAGTNQDNKVSSESRVFILFIMIWQTLFKVSDRGIVVLLNFFKSFLIMIGTLANCDGVVKFAQTLPQTMYLAKFCLGIGRDEFEKFAACPSCMTLYKLEECTTERSNGRMVSNKCTHISFPNHPQRRKRKQCGALLMKRMRSKSGTLFLHPKKLYCYRRLSDSLKAVLTRPGFLDKCEAWRKREIHTGFMGDVFEGKVWKEFLDFDGKQYFSTPGNFGVMLNVDWFQPYKHTNHSCGVLYLVLMNLPREERFKQENVMIAGIIPGPHEPKGNINSFLKPLVNELIDLWDGIIFEDSRLPGGMFKVRVALLALCCDVPAARKCGGFAGHSARRGCNKCFKTFPCETFGSKPDFSGFNMENWEKRTNKLHRIHAESMLLASSPAQMKAIVRNTGAKYSVLFQLPYYDVVRFVLIDPMHNLFLGVAKHVLKTWKTKGLLSDQDFQVLQKRANAVIPPPEIGRIPTKIATGFSGFTADQWKNWVCYYSVFALKGILPKEHYNTWLHFVDACCLICCQYISEHQCSKSKESIVKFCKAFEQLYGPEMCTPNMHLSCHLSECVADYGPVYSFWCFSFERYNGILGSYHKNNHNIGIQLMRKFLRDNDLLQMEFPKEFKDYKDLLSSPQTGTVGEMSGIQEEVICNMSKKHIVPCPPVSRIALDRKDATYLSNMYERLYPECEIGTILRISDTFSRLELGGKVTRCSQTMCLKAKWFDNEERPCRIIRFLSHDIFVKKDGKRQKMTHVLAEVQWFQSHPEKNWFPPPVEVWSIQVEPRCASSFVPVTSFLSHCMTVKYKVKFNHGPENVYVIIPLIGRFSSF